MHGQIVGPENHRVTVKSSKELQHWRSQQIVNQWGGVMRDRDCYLFDFNIEIRGKMKIDKRRGILISFTKGESS